MQATKMTTTPRGIPLPILWRSKADCHHAHMKWSKPAQLQLATVATMEKCCGAGSSQCSASASSETCFCLAATNDEQLLAASMVTANWVASNPTARDNGAESANKAAAGASKQIPPVTSPEGACSKGARLLFLLPNSRGLVITVSRRSAASKPGESISSGS